MKILKIYLKNRKETLDQLIETHDLDIDRNRLDELKKLEVFLQDTKRELNNI